MNKKVSLANNINLLDITGIECYPMISHRDCTHYYVLTDNGQKKFFTADTDMVVFLQQLREYENNTAYYDDDYYSGSNTSYLSDFYDDYDRNVLAGAEQVEFTRPNATPYIPTTGFNPETVDDIIAMFPSYDKYHNKDNKDGE